MRHGLIDEYPVYRTVHVGVPSGAESTERYIPLSRMPSDEDRRALYSHLSAYGRFTGLWWIMTPEPPEPQPLPIPTINEIITSQEFVCPRQREPNRLCTRHLLSGIM